MTETMFVALISACSALIGTVAGAFGVIWSSHESAKSQMKTKVIEECYAVRVAAFYDLLNSHYPLLRDPKNVELIHAFHQSVDRACLAASPETAAAILIFRDSVLGALPAPGAASDLLIAMQRDLTTFTTPKLRRNTWPKKLHIGRGISK